MLDIQAVQAKFQLFQDGLLNDEMFDDDLRLPVRQVRHRPLHLAQPGFPRLLGPMFFLGRGRERGALPSPKPAFHRSFVFPSQAMSIRSASLARTRPS